MKKILGAAVVTAALACSAAAQPSLGEQGAAKPSPDQQAITALIKQMANESASADADALAKYYEPQALIVAKGGLNHGFAAYKAKLQKEIGQMRAAARGLNAGGTLTSSHSVSEVVVNTDGSLAWATYSYSVTANVDGQDKELWGIGTLTLRKRAGQWRIVQAQANAKPREAWAK